MLLAFPATASANETEIYTDLEWAYTLEFPNHLQVLNEGNGCICFIDNDGTEVVSIDCYADPARRGYNPLGTAIDAIYEILDYMYYDWEILGEEYEQTWQEYDSGELWYSAFDGDIWWQECDYIIEADGIVYIISMIWPEEDMAEYWDDFYQIVYSFAIL
jgi:hypothetical protein